MKAQRIKITESGMTTYSDMYCGIKFTNGVSDEAVAPSVQNQIGAYIRVEAIDGGEQVGEARVYQDAKKNKAPVKKALVDETPTVESPEAAKVAVRGEKYTRKGLEEIADLSGIGGLREIADTFGVKGRGIVELINEILQAQA